MMARALFAGGFLALIPAVAGAYSNAANTLIAEEIAAACEGRPGEIESTAAIERDLTGDGRADLIISHEGITCAGGGRSTFCGAQLCVVNFYVRRGALLKLEHEMLGAGVRVGRGLVPAIHLDAHGGKRGALQWNGRRFR